MELIAGRVLEKEHISPDADENHADTIWNDRLEQISIQRYYEVNGYGDYKKFYGTAADAEAVSKVRMRRYAQRPDRRNKDMTNAKTIKIAVPFIRRNSASRTWTRSASRCFARRTTGTSSATGVPGIRGTEGGLIHNSMTGTNTFETQED